MDGKARAHDESIQKKLQAETARAEVVQRIVSGLAQIRANAEFKGDGLLQQKSVQPCYAGADGNVPQEHARR